MPLFLPATCKTGTTIPPLVSRVVGLLVHGFMHAASNYWCSKILSALLAFEKNSLFLFVLVSLCDIYM